MSRVKIKSICLSALLMLMAWSLKAQSKVVVLDLHDEVHSSMARYVKRGFEEAEREAAKLVILHIDTYGGRVDYADSIRSEILNSKIPTAALIDRNAASAGALIAIACDSIYMVKGASMGAATVVEEDGKAAPDKYQSYWRGVMRATAEARGRDPKIAEKMVDQNLEIEGLSPVGQVITFTTQDAMEHGYCEGELPDVKAVAGAMGISNAQVIAYEGTAVDQVINFLIHPTVSAILLLLIFGGIFLELKTPGFGFAGTTALIAAFLFFGPHYVNGLAESWEIAIFILGVVLIALELFVIPGFGFAGILGILLSVMGISAALLENNGISFDYISPGDFLRSIAMVLVMLSTAILLVLWLARYLVTSRVAYPFVDGATQRKEDGYVAVSDRLKSMVGQEGSSLTDLRPIGFVEIDGQQFDATAKEGFIQKGQAIVVDRIDSIYLVVRKLQG